MRYSDVPGVCNERSSIDPCILGPNRDPSNLLSNMQENQPPAARMTCNICNSHSNVSLYDQTRDYIPIVGYLSLIFGVLLGLLVILLIKVQHKFRLPFCEDCWRRFRFANRLESVSLFGLFLSVILGTALLLNFDTAIAFFAPLIVFGCLVIVAQKYKRKNSPHFKTVNRKKVVVNTPSGLLEFAK